jgi:aspartate racemase
MSRVSRGKTIGILGGMSWESTALYYRLLNQRFNKRLGGVHSAPTLISSVDFNEIRQYQLSNQWDEAGAILSAHARSLEHAGAAAIAMAVNTMHRVASTVTEKLSIPFIDIRDTTLTHLVRKKYSNPLLLGTSFVTDPAGFYVQYFRSRAMTVHLPTPEESLALDRIIFEEFPVGVFSNESAQYCKALIQRHQADAGIDSVVLACTELPILFRHIANVDANNDLESVTLSRTSLPLVDTVVAHVDALVNASLAN